MRNDIDDTVRMRSGHTEFVSCGRDALDAILSLFTLHSAMPSFYAMVMLRRRDSGPSQHAKRSKQANLAGCTSSAYSKDVRMIQPDEKQQSTTGITVDAVRPLAHACVAIQPGSIKWRPATCYSAAFEHSQHPIHLLRRLSMLEKRIHADARLSVPSLSRFAGPSATLDEPQLFHRLLPGPSSLYCESPLSNRRFLLLSHVSKLLSW